MKKILVLAGASAVGKTTVMSEILKLYDRFEFIRSATTRPPRGDGRDGEYIYLTKSEFLDRIKSGAMLEYTEYGGNLYGTPRSEIERILESDKLPALILDINGAVSLKSSDYSDSVFAVYLWDAPERLEARLRERIALAPSIEEGERIFRSRIAANKSDFERIKSLNGIFDMVLKNDTVTETAKTIIKSAQL